MVPITLLLAVVLLLTILAPEALGNLLREALNVIWPIVKPAGRGRVNLLEAVIGNTMLAALLYVEAYTPHGQLGLSFTVVSIAIGVLLHVYPGRKLLIAVIAILQVTLIGMMAWLETPAPQSVAVAVVQRSSELVAVACCIRLAARTLPVVIATPLILPLGVLWIVCYLLRIIRFKY